MSPSLTDAGGPPAAIWGDRTAALSEGVRKFVLGFRPLRIVGAEIQSLDLGEGALSLRGGGGGQVPQQAASVRSSTEGWVATALLFIPERALRADVYAKIGVAHLDETLKVSGYDSLSSGCQPACAFDISFEKGGTVPHVGFGVRFEVARVLGLRVEYEAIDRDGADPARLLSLGIAAEF